MKVEASITGKRQMTIPKDLYNDMGLKNTDKLVFTKNNNGEIVVSKKEINNLDICPVCKREVKNEGAMVVEKSQKYHIKCWSLCKDDNKLIEDEYIANRVTKAQRKALEKLEDVKKEHILEMLEKLKDNEVIINVPIKLTFMESKPGVVGMISEFSSKKIFDCNKEAML